MEFSVHDEGKRLTKQRRIYVPSRGSLGFSGIVLVSRVRFDVQISCTALTVCRIGRKNEDDSPRHPVSEGIRVSLGFALSDTFIRWFLLAWGRASEAQQSRRSIPTTGPH